MSDTVLWIMCAVIVISLAVWLTAVLMADRTPYFRHTSGEHRRGSVTGGTHTAGGGRSVMPPRDEPAAGTGNSASTSTSTGTGTGTGTGETAGTSGTTGKIDTGRTDTRVPHPAGRPRGKSGNPLDL
jgi:hypothetical protein